MMDAEKLERIIENHSHWLNENANGWEAMCANLSEADLSFANLRYANLSGADLSNANLRFANLRWANLSGADLRGADLSGTNLRYANLSEANLREANLSDADLSGSDLSEANLCEANLCETNLRRTNLRYANLRGAKNVPYIPMICPEEGSFIGYKKASGKIVKLYIPEDAKRSSATTRKCRCNKAKVLGIYELDGSISTVTKVASTREPNFIYKINKEVVVKDFDEDRWNECSTGIHFFMQRYEAVKYLI